MLSVVVPTMWRYEPFQFVLECLLDEEIVSEIILIDNDPSKAPHWVNNLVLSNRGSKIRYVRNEYNIFVNPAFNLGVEMAKNENICIINDDVHFASNTLYAAEKFMDEHKECGVLGICPGETKFGQPPFRDGTIDFVQWRPEESPGMFFGFCMLFFVRKSEWLPIPHGLDIYYGDDWVVRTQPYFGREIYSITNSFFYTPYSQTCSQLTLPSDTLAREGEIYIREFNKLTGKEHKMAEYDVQPEYISDVMKRNATNILHDGMSIDQNVNYDLILFGRGNIASLNDVGSLGTSFIIIEGIDSSNFADISYYALDFMNRFKQWVLNDFFYKENGTSVIVLAKQAA